MSGTILSYKAINIEQNKSFPSWNSLLNTGCLSHAWNLADFNSPPHPRPKVPSDRSC